MGGCVSCEAAAVAMAVTAKLVLPDGGLLEYSRPVTAAHALGKDAALFFVCDADGMEFDTLLSALGADEELRLGQLYFVLPRKMLSYPLRAEDLAALAVKASAALVGGAGRCCRGAVAPLVFPEVKAKEEAASDRRGKDKPRKSRRDGGGGWRRRYAPELMAIPE